MYFAQFFFVQYSRIFLFHDSFSWVTVPSGYRWSWGDRVSGGRGELLHHCLCQVGQEGHEGQDGQIHIQNVPSLNIFGTQIELFEKDGVQISWHGTQGLKHLKIFFSPNLRKNISNFRVISSSTVLFDAWEVLSEPVRIAATHAC